jgi:hypothetical protein
MIPRKAGRISMPFLSRPETFTKTLPSEQKPRLENPRECHAQHSPRPRRNPKQITVLVLMNENAEENACHRSNEKDDAQDPEEEVVHAAPALSRTASALAARVTW